MTYVVHRIRCQPNEVETELADYLNNATIGTLHSIQIQKYGTLFEIFITYE